MLKLFHANHSTCSQKVRLCLAEKGLAFASQLVNLATNEHLMPEYLKLNPNGVVPTLVHDDAVITDSGVICEYLDEVFPDTPMLPSDPAQRAVVRAWGRYLDEVPTAAIRVPSFNMAFLPRFDALDDAAFQEQQADVRPIRKQFYERMGRKGFNDAEVDAAMDQFTSTLVRMEKRLAQVPWLSGQAFGLADIIVLPLVDRMDDLSFASMWENGFPLVTDWFTRAKQRPSFETAFYPKARLSEFLTISPLRV
ncbi:glutathione S-transferase family protein [Planktotalea sp.]|uniref:glutathione S-transferase family protein n=1 Tax=Planktotalea sp. TaxID=2029877 RepID=UPI0025DC1F93|nr:glutathione S-transferase family protein [Planktotalea sp.]